MSNNQQAVCVLGGVAVGAVGALAVAHFMRCRAEPTPSHGRMARNSADERAAEAELENARKASIDAMAENPDEKITGLSLSGETTKPLYFSVSGEAAPQYLSGVHPGEQQPVLTYFAIQGLGEVPRLLLAEAGAAYDHLCVIGNEDQAIQDSWRNRSPNGLLPTLSGMGMSRASPLSQSSSVVRHLASRFGMQGASEQDRCIADCLFETSKDLSNKKEEIAQMGAKELVGIGKAKGPWALALRLEKMVASSPSIVDPDSALTYGQLQLLHVLIGFEEHTPGCVAYMSSELETFRAAGIVRPRIAKYLASVVRFPALIDGSYNYKEGPLVRSDLMNAC